MKIKYFPLIPVLTCLLVFSFIQPGSGQKGEQGKAKPYVEKTADGQVDWTNQYIEAVGVNFMNWEKFPNEQQAYWMAVRGAEVVAKANLLEMTEGITVYRETTVQDLTTESDIIRTRVEGVIKGARVVGEPRRNGDMVEVTVRIPLYQDGLGDVLYEKAKEKSDSANYPVDPNYPPITPSKDTLGNEGGKDVENVDDGKVSTPVSETGGETPQFILTFKDGKFDPSLFPVILDEKGNLVIDFSQWYDQIPPDKLKEMLKYVEFSKEAAKVFKAEKVVDFIEVFQDPDGKLRVNLEKHPKFRNFLQKAVDVGKVVLPFVLSLI